MISPQAIFRPCRACSRRFKGKISDHVCVSSMAGEGEQVAAIMHEFMDIHAGDERRRSLLRTDEINRQQQDEPGENRPWQKLSDLGRRTEQRNRFGQRYRK